MRIAWLVVVALTGAIALRRFGRHNVGRRRDVVDGGNYPAKVYTYKGMRVDHFTYTDTRTFDLRWMLNDTYYQPGGPIFFYTGNEGNITTFLAATGIIFDIAPLFNATIVFAEHRFYGATKPFGDQSYANTANLGYLTSEQALGDFAQLITELKTPKNQFGLSYPANSKVITFGGSYGGMLSSWFRQKYPHIVDGAWTGSAPLIYFRDGGVAPGVFDNITSNTYVAAGCNRYILANGWNATLRLASTPSGRDWLNANLKLDPRTPIKTPTDGWLLNYSWREAIEYMAMTDYPYPTGFLEPLPGWPVNQACGFMNATGTTFTDEQLVTMLASAANVYLNSANDPSYQLCIDESVCGDAGTGGLGGDDLGWPWQACTEIVMPMCSQGGNNDVFWNECGDDIIATLLDSCSQTFSGLKGWSKDLWNVDAVKTLYGLDLSGASNIILTQGNLDPWSGGGYKTDRTNVDRGIYVIPIDGSAHHLDLRQPNKCDPNTITNARFQIVGIIKCWVYGCSSPPTLQPLPSVQIPNGPCGDIINGYPWGQSTQSATIASLVPVVVVSALLSFFL